MMNYMAAVPLGLGIGAGLMAVLYMAARLFQLEGLKAWVRLELGELAVSAILVAIVVSAYNLQTPLIDALSGSQNPAWTIHNGLEKPLEASLESLARTMMRLTKVISYNFNYQTSFYLFASTSSSSPSAGAGVLLTEVMGGADTTSMTLLLTRGVRVGWQFLSFAAFFFLMPIGLILRFIPPTRRLAGTLLGISLALNLVFPVAIAWSVGLGSWMVDFQAPMVEVENRQMPAVAGAICSETMSGMYTAGEVVAPLMLSIIPCLPALLWPGAFVACVGKPGTPATSDPTATGLSGLLSTLWAIAQIFFSIAGSLILQTSDLAISPGVAVEYYNVLMDKILPVVLARNLATLLVMVMAIAPTVVLARNFAQVLGGEGQFYGLAKLV